MLESQDESLSQHILRAIRNRVPWFDVLDGLGVLGSWLTSDREDDRNDAMQLVHAPAVFERRSAAASRLLRKLVGGGASDTRHLLMAMSFGNVEHSREMMDLFLDLIDDGTLDDARGLGASGDWWLVLYGMATSKPAYCSEAIGHWLDRQYALAGQRCDGGRGTERTWSNLSEDVTGKAAAGAPFDFAREVLPRVARAASGPEGESWEYLSGVYRDLVKALQSALRDTAVDDPDALDALFESLPPDMPLIIEKLRLEAWAANPARYADEILRRLIEHVELLDWRVEPIVRVATTLANPVCPPSLNNVCLRTRLQPNGSRTTATRGSGSCCPLHPRPSAVRDRRTSENCNASSRESCRMIVACCLSRSPLAPSRRRSRLPPQSA